MKANRIDRAAARLRETLPVFTRENLRHASGLSPAAFDAALAKKRGRVEGLVRPTRGEGPRLSAEEKRAYYPAGILLVDRPALVDLFAASGALIQGRVAVVSTSGEPRHVVDWLVAGARAGRSAPVGYVHDATTVLYPFFFEPLATLGRARVPVRFRDLGLRPGRGFRDPYTRKRAYDLEAVTPAALVTYAVRAVLEMVQPDLMLAPRKP